MRKRKLFYHLYFVDTPSPEENCFVASTSSASAAKLERDESGFNGDECKATRLRNLSADWIAAYVQASASVTEIPKAFYVTDEYLSEIGIITNVISGDWYFTAGDHVFVRQGEMNYLGWIISNSSRKSSRVLIRSVADLLEIVTRDAPGRWIFRGQASCLWPLNAGIFRVTGECTIKNAEEIEKAALKAFRKRARAFLSDIPKSDWEWLTIAQHYGLPARLLDWTENPLVALYFAVNSTRSVIDDRIIYAYDHGTPELDIDEFPDPFGIQKVELVRPSHVDQRVIVQQSIFTVEPRKRDITAPETSRLLYWHVPKDCIEDINRELANIGISEHTLLPGLESIAKNIRQEISR